MRKPFIITYGKVMWRPKRRSIRVQWVIPADSQHEAKTISAKEMIRLQGYRYLGVD